MEPARGGRLAREWDDKTERSEQDAFGRVLYDTASSDRVVVDRVGEIANERAIPRAQVALAWMLSKPVITTPIVGATKPNHFEDAVAAVDVELTDEEITRLEQPYVPHPVAGFA